MVEEQTSDVIGGLQTHNPVNVNLLESVSDYFKTDYVIYLLRVVEMNFRSVGLATVSMTYHVINHIKRL